MNMPSASSTSTLCLLATVASRQASLSAATASTVDRVSSRFSSLSIVGQQTQEHGLLSDVIMPVKSSSPLASLSVKCGNQTTSPLQEQMLMILSQRLHKNPSFVTPIWRLITGILSKYIVYTSNDPAKALQEALVQLQTILTTRKVNKKKAAAGWRYVAADSVIRAKKRRICSHTTTTRREAVLELVLCKHIVRIKKILKHTAHIRRIIGSHGYFSANNCQMACFSSDIKVDKYQSIDLPMILPTVARRILFDNQLCRVINTAPVEQLRTIDWNLLVDQAEADLRAFDDWIEQQQSPQQQQLAASCA